MAVMGGRVDDKLTPCVSSWFQPSSSVGQRAPRSSHGQQCRQTGYCQSSGRLGLATLTIVRPFLVKIF